MTTNLLGVAKLPEAHSCALQVGHSGTLDPMATGLLIICTGSGTKSADTFQAMHKEYTGGRASAPLWLASQRWSCIQPCSLTARP